MDSSNVTMVMGNGTVTTSNLKMGNGTVNTTNLSINMDTDMVEAADNTTSLVSYLADVEVCITMDGSWMMYALPVVLAMGLVGNCATGITILCRRLNTENAIFGFFLFISINDLIVNVMAAKEYVLSLSPEFTWPSDLSCSANWYPQTASMTTSSWILVAANLYKLYVLAFPLKAFHMKGVKIATVTSVVIMVSMYVCATHVFWFVGPQVIIDENANVTVYQCYYDLANYEWLIYVDMMFYNILPGVILIVTSVAMFVIFMRQYRQHKALKQGEGRAKVKASVTFRHTKNTVSILLPASFLHIVCTLPINLMWFIVDQRTRNLGQIRQLYCISLLLMYTNHSLNVYIQSLSSKKFRNSLLGRDK